MQQQIIIKHKLHVLVLLVTNRQNLNQQLIQSITIMLQIIIMVITSLIVMPTRVLLMPLMGIILVMNMEIEIQY